MRVKLQQKLQPVEHRADSVVVEDELGNPIYVALQHDNHIICASVGDDDFHALLRALGINKTVTVTDLQPKPVENVIWTP